MKQEQLNAIKERVAKATQGPWKVYSDEFSTRIGTELIHPQLKAPAPVITEAFHGKDKVGIYISAKDSEFIVNAIEDVPALVAEVERLQEALEKIMEVEAPIEEVWETRSYKIARQALGGEVHE